ncbi:MAG: alpha-2-macroglobulin family protein [Opitutaceae bacterium]|nr:alpha-2-macroglobulin family protein [Opitutaceae bacterium]
MPLHTRSPAPAVPFALSWLVLLIAFSFASPTLRAAVGASYEQELAAAKALGSEGSWAKAREAYAGALTLAPNRDSHRWCELWLEDATWRGEATLRLSAYRAGVKKHLDAYNSFLKPYADGQLRDEFWMAALQSEADFERSRNDFRHWSMRLDIADYLANQAPSAEAARRYVGFLRQLFALSGPIYGWPDGRLLAHLDNGARIGAMADDRAWCLLLIASLSAEKADLSLTERDELWRSALVGSHATLWEPLVRAEELIWRIRRRCGKNPPEGSPADAAAALVALEAMRSELSPLSGAEAAQAVKALQAFGQRLAERKLILTAPEQVPQGTPVRFSFGAANLQSLHATLVQQPLKSWLAAAANDNEERDADERIIREWDVALADVRRGAWTTNAVEAAPRLDPGIYQLRLVGSAGAESVSQTAEFIVSDFGGVAFTDENGVTDVFVERLVTGEPVPNAAVKGFVGAHEVPIGPLETKTDVEGRFRIPALTPESDSGRTEILAAAVDGQPIALKRWVRGRGRFVDRMILDAIFDRPIYRPGETVHWKLIARERDRGRFVLPSETPGLVLGVELNNEPIFGPAPLKFDSFGTAQGELVIPATAKPGEANIVVGVGEDEKAKRLGWLHEVFRVDNFVVPAIEAKIELASGVDSLRPGRAITVRANVSYLSGGPVTDAKVECRFSCSWFAAADEQGRFPAGPEAQTWMQALAREPQRGKTDAAGVAEFKLQLPPDLADSWLSADVSVLPDGAAEVKARSAWGINRSGVFLDTQEWRQPLETRPGADLIFDGRILSGANAPVPFHGIARLVELSWAEAWLDPTGSVVVGVDLARVPRGREPLGQNGDRSAWRRLHGGYSETIVATQPVSTDAQGRFNARFKVPRTGVFQIQVYRDDTLVIGGDRDLTVGPTVFAVDTQTETLSLPPDQGFILGPSSVAPAQPFDLLAVLPEGIKSGWINLCGEDSVITQRIVPHGRVAHITIGRPPALAGYARAELVWRTSDEQRVGSASAICSFPCRDSSLPLRVSLTAKEALARPGAASTVGVKVALPSGKSVKAELGITVFDEAVAILAGRSGQINPVGFGQIQHITSVRSESFGSRLTNEPAPMADNRLGEIPLATSTGVISPGSGGYPGGIYVTDESDGEVVLLSPFCVESAEDEGYQASETLAGTRVRTELRDVRPMNAVEGADPSLKIEVRRHFSSTAFWAPDIVTSDTGEATVSFKYPDNLTQWRLEAYAVGADGNTFGRTAAYTRTSLPFQARLQLPRFLVAGDTVEPTAVLVNRTDSDTIASAELNVTGPVVAMDPTQQSRNGIAIAKQGEAHTAWTVRAKAAGEAELTLKGRTESDGDALVRTLTILEDGIQQQTAATGKLAPDANSLVLKLELPGSLDPRRTRVTVQLVPSYAAAILDALPYLVDYPYGCVEQTMSRFLPAAIVQKTLTDLGLSAAEVEQRILRNETKADARRRSATGGLNKIGDVAQKSLARLAEAQRSDGGFGWWPGAGSTNLWMTSYVAWGLAVARTAGIDVPTQLEANTQHALVRALSIDEDVTDEHAWALAALAHARFDDKNSNTTVQAAFERVFAAREKLSATGRACLAQAAARLSSAEQRAILLRNLENGLERVRSPDLGDTAHWGETAGYWRATDGAVEATSLTLLALLELNPKHPLVDPATNWLVLNRRSSHWQSTRDSAFAVLALTRYIAQRRELGGEVEAELFANGDSLGRVKLNRDSLLKNPVGVTVPTAALRPGTNSFTLRRVAGKGPLYVMPVASAWAAGDAVKPAGHMVSVVRGFVRQKSEPTLIGTLKITPEPLPDGGSATAGERVTAIVKITVPNDLEYVMIEVPKPAGCEPLNALSGWDARIHKAMETSESAGQDEGEPIYREERDDKSVFFLDSLDAGTWEIRFGMRAVTPGDFRALPVQVTAMYVPEIAANSGAQRVKIQRAR